MGVGDIRREIVVIFKTITSGFRKDIERTNAQMRRFNTTINNQNSVMAKQNLQIVSASKQQRNMLRQTVARGNAVAKVEKLQAENTRMNQIARGGFSKTMGLGTQEYKKFNEQNRRFTTIGGRMANSVRNSTHGLRGFRMEMLGVMFFGMAMQRMFTGLLRPVMEAFGVFDLFRLMLLVLFIPIMELMFPVILKVMEFFMNLSESTKLIIGSFVLIGAAVGAALFILGTLALGIGSLILVFKGLFGWLGLIAAGIAGVAGLTLIIDFFRQLATKSDDAKTKLAEFGVSGEVFDAVSGKIVTLFGTLKDGADTHLPTFKEKFKNMFRNLLDEISSMGPEWSEAGMKIFGHVVDGITDFLKKNPMVVIGAMIGAWFGGPAGASIGAGIGLMFQKIDLEKMDEITEKGLEILDGILDGIEKNKDKIGEAFGKVLVALGTWIGQNSGRIAKIGISIGTAIANGIMVGLLNIGAGIGNKISNFFGRESNVQFQTGGGITNVTDFILQPGGRLIKTDPQDTIVGFKGGGGGFGGGSTNITNNFNGFTMDELRRELDDRDRRIVENVRRSIQT